MTRMICENFSCHLDQYLRVIVDFLAQVPFNIWLWMWPLAAPALVFSAKPTSSEGWRMARLALAVGSGHVLHILAVHTHHTIRWKAYEACLIAHGYHPNGIDSPEACRSLGESADGASIIFALVLGWLLAAGYAGIWELVWRIRHRLEIARLGRNFGSKWASTLFIAAFTPPFTYVAFVAMIYAVAVYLGWE